MCSECASTVGEANPGFENPYSLLFAIECVALGGRVQMILRSAGSSGFDVNAALTPQHPQTFNYVCAEM